MGLFEQLPYANFHEMNLAWVLEQVATAKMTADEALEYIKNLDVNDAISDKLDEMAASGEFNALINPIVAAAVPPIVVSNVADMVNTDKTYVLASDGHVYQYDNGWIDTGLVYGGSIGNVFTYEGVLAAGANLDNMNPNTVYLVQSGAIPYNAPTTVPGYVQTTGATPGAKSQMYTELGTGAVHYRAYTSGQWGAWRTQSFTFVGTLAATDDLDNMEGQTCAFISSGAIPTNAPSSVAAFVYTFGISGGISQQFVKELHTAKAYYRRRVTGGQGYGAWMDGNGNSLQYIGSATSPATPLPDLNDAPGMTIYVVNSGSGLLNMPVDETGFLYTVGLSGSARTQIFIGWNSASIFYRHSTSNSAPYTWTAWQSVVSEGVGNSNAHMYSIGNSILTGSVFINGSMDHLSVYGNAPYSVVADAIGIPKSNVVHRLISSTGLVYDAGEGSFLQNIKQVDLTPYDVLLTHLYTSDMGTTLGTAASTAGDGTIAGAVKDLVDYMRTSNGNCQLILVGVTPTSTTHYGNAVFTGLYGNGKSIADCDAVLQQIADDMHFTFISWQDMALSYYYQNYTDGLNVHANNEDTYRSMGGYLGGRASAGVHF